MAWWRKTFNEDYLTIYGPQLELRTDMEIRGFLDLAEPQPSARILDLGCGQGRHTVALAQMGFQVTGYDQSNILLHRARQRAQEAGVQPHFVRGCFSQLQERNRYHFVLSLYHSFGYFEREEDQLDLLRRIHRSLRPQGLLFLDMWGLQQLEPHLGCHQVQTPDFLFQESVSLVEESQPWGRRWRLEIEHELRRPNNTKRYQHRLRLYKPEQLQALLELAEFDDIRLYGGFSGESTDQGDRLIALARRKG